jgi:hypothetical protein
VTALAASAGALSADGPGGRGKDESVERLLINGVRIEGKIIERNDKGFTLRMDVGGVVTDVELPWSALRPEDVERLRAGRKATETDAARIAAEARRLDKRADDDVRAEPRIEEQLPQITDKLRKSLRRSVVGSYYRMMDDLILDRVWGRVAEVVVTLRSGESVRGKLVSEDGEDFVVVVAKGRTIKIASELVADISQAAPDRRRRAPGFAESKKYVEDATGGITADILKGLVEQYKEFSTPQLPIDRKLIEGFWKDRLTSIVVVTREGRERMPVCASHEATYGTGTWLREGTRTAEATGSRGGEHIETDPEKWWASQPREVRCQILKAIAAEALCKVDKVIKTCCGGCDGKGGSVTVGSAPMTRVCAACRGSGYSIRIRYR